MKAIFLLISLSKGKAVFSSKYLGFYVLLEKTEFFKVSFPLL